MSDEDNDLSVLCIIELVERDGFATAIKDLQLAGLTEGLLIRFGIIAALFLRHGYRQLIVLWLGICK